MDKLLFYPTSLPFIPLCSFHRYTFFTLLLFLLVLYVHLSIYFFFTLTSLPFIPLCSLHRYTFFTLLLFLLFLSVHFINILLFTLTSLPFIPLCSLHRYTSFLSYSSSFYTSLFTSSHVDLTVLSIFQKAVTFDHNLSPYTSLYSNFLK